MYRGRLFWVQLMGASCTLRNMSSVTFIIRKAWKTVCSPDGRGEVAVELMWKDWDNLNHATFITRRSIYHNGRLTCQQV